MPDGKSQYTIELLPSTGTQCTPGQNAHVSMLDSSSGTFRIRATGRAGDVTRTVVTTLRRRSFLDFIYFTDYETRDPAQYPDPDDAAWAAVNCAKPRASRPSGCVPIQFGAADEINGPLHTNDDLLTCGGVKFGRDKDDNIEASGPAGWTNASGCSGSPNFQGTWIPNATPLNVPPTNAGLAAVAQPAYTYTGKTTIRLKGNVMDVTTGTPAVTTTNVPLPTNGVIYVQNGACTGTKTPLLQRYDDPVGCAVVYVSGTYAQQPHDRQRERHRDRAAGRLEQRRPQEGPDVGRRARPDREQQRARLPPGHALGLDQPGLLHERDRHDGQRHDRGRDPRARRTRSSSTTSAAATTWTSST